MSKRSDPDHPELQRPTTKRAKQIDNATPYDELVELLEEQQPQQQSKKKKGTKAHSQYVVHWFRSKDLRSHDNRALHAGSTLAADQGKSLICIYLDCPAEFAWHGTSPARLDFIFETLRLMQSELKKLNVPLVFLRAGRRDEIVPTVVEFLVENGVEDVFANFEYEVDELRRDVKVLEYAKDNDNAFHMSLHHDQCVVEPGTMTNNSGTPMKVFTPYHRAWLALVKDSPELLDTVPAPRANDASSSKEFSSFFDSKVPSAPKDKKVASDKECDRLCQLWPAGHEAGMERMRDFIQNKIEDYAATRSQPAKDSSSRMSAYFSAGVVSVREALSEIKAYNNGSADFSTSGSSEGIYSWVREVVFRELYRQTTLMTPHTSMNLPQNLKFDFVEWLDDEEGWTKWREGKTGVPFVDAGMRQLNHEAYMHNRLRMNVSSYLYCNLLIDYRRGERHFAETLIDWDLSNNTQGWEPSYTVFNPTSQAEKNDPDGEYIRKWVPELAGVKGKAVFAPHERLSEKDFEKLGYPRPHVDWKATKARAVETFKNDMAGVEP